jgi:hypothetical protein
MFSSVFINIVEVLVSFRVLLNFECYTNKYLISLLRVSLFKHVRVPILVLTIFRDILISQKIYRS